MVGYAKTVLANGLYADAHGTGGSIGPGEWIFGIGAVVFLIEGIAILQGRKPDPRLFFDPAAYSRAYLFVISRLVDIDNEPIPPAHPSARRVASVSRAEPK